VTQPAGNQGEAKQQNQPNPARHAAILVFVKPNRPLTPAAPRTPNPEPCYACQVERTANLSKDDLIDVQGTVVAVHSGGLYRVQVDAGHEVLAQLSGRMRRFRIKVVPGDRVTVGVSPYDPVRGIITFRAR
jgi:translation initiation factor IF-1